MLAVFNQRKKAYFLDGPGAFSWPVSTLCSRGSAPDSRVLLTRGRNGRCSAWCTVVLTIWLVSVEGHLSIGVLRHPVLPRFLGIDPRPLKSRIYGLTACWPYFEGQNQCFRQVLEKGESLTRRDESSSARPGSCPFRRWSFLGLDTNLSPCSCKFGDSPLETRTAPF